MVIWITGITASGKTTLGKNLFNDLQKLGYKKIIHLDGDNLRKRKDWVSGHSIEKRKTILKKIVEVCNEELKTNLIVIVSTVSHMISMRRFARNKLPLFFEVFLDIEPRICAKRDFKGLYKKAEKDRNIVFPGVTEEYEEYEEYDLKLKTGIDEIKICSTKLLKFVKQKLETI